MAAGVIPVRYFCKVCGWASGSNLKPLDGCGRCGVIEPEQLLVPNKSSNIQLLDEQEDPIVQGAMMDSIGVEVSPAQVLPTQGSSSAAASKLDRPKIKKVLGPEEKISPHNFASPAPAFTISLDQVKKNTMADPNLVGNMNNPKFLIDDNKMGDFKPNNRQQHVNRRSRAYSWQFVKNVVNQKNDLAIPNAVLEEPAHIEARPVVKSIVDLVPMYRTKDGTLSCDAIENILTQEKLQGTLWREIADETIMELILNGLSAVNFIVALINAYDIPVSDVGLFLATPPDEGTMSLIEEAVCQDSLDLFLEVLRMDEKLLKGLLECKDTTEQVHKEIFDLLNDVEA